MTLFDEINRIDNGPALYAEPQFTYLNRSARQDVRRVRAVLEDWFSRYPAGEQADLRGRLRSPDDSHHRAAFFELFLHELLLRLGCRVQIHPSPSEATTKCPDFLVESPNDTPFYTEAVLASDESAQETAARARMNTVYDALDRMDSPNFFIGMNLRGAPQTPPPVKQIRSFLIKRLASLDPDEIASYLESAGLDALPHWPYEHEGWEIVFFPIPKSPNLRGKAGVRPIGVQSSGWHWLDTRLAIRDAVVTKASRYGDLDLPYVIAVNALGEHVDRIDIMEALFGREQLLIRDMPFAPNEPEMVRAPDGAWTSKSGPRYTRVSAVLIAAPVFPWNVPRAPICLYHNPWANKPCTGELTLLPQAIPNGDRMEWEDGESLARIFGLSSGWPKVEIGE